MTFPASAFEKVKAVLVTDTRAPAERLFRYRTKGSRDPYYKFELETQEQEYKHFIAVDAALDAYHGEEEIFLLPNPMPSIKAYAGLSLFSSPVKGADTITIAGFPPNTADVVWPGDFIKIEGSQKGYRIAALSSSDASGNANVTLTQGIIQAYTAGATVDYGDDVVFQVSMVVRDSDTTDATKSKYGSHAVELIEQL